MRLKDWIDASTGPWQAIDVAVIGFAVAVTLIVLAYAYYLMRTDDL